MGTVAEVMVEGPSKRNASRLSGRDGGNRIVVWETPEGEPAPREGAFVNVRIADAHPQTLIGEVQ